MKFVEIYKIQNNGSKDIIAVCRLENKKVTCEGEKIFIENLKKEGIPDYLKNEGAKLFPKDGIKFLENLKLAFKSGYLNASGIQEK